MRPEIRLTPPRRARRRMAGLVIPWMLSRRTFLCRLAPPLPRPFPPLPRPVMMSSASEESTRRSDAGCPEVRRYIGERGRPTATNPERGFRTLLADQSEAAVQRADGSAPAPRTLHNHRPELSGISVSSRLSSEQHRLSSWHVPSRPPGRVPEGRLPASSWPPKPPGSLLRPPEE